MWIGLILTLSSVISPVNSQTIYVPVCAFLKMIIGPRGE